MRNFDAHSRRTIEVDLLGRSAEFLASTCHYCIHDHSPLFSRTNEYGELIIHFSFWSPSSVLAWFSLYQSQIISLHVWAIIRVYRILRLRRRRCCPNSKAIGSVHCRNTSHFLRLLPSFVCRFFWGKRANGFDNLWHYPVPKLTCWGNFSPWTFSLLIPIYSRQATDNCEIYINHSDGNGIRSVHWGFTWSCFRLLWQQSKVSNLNSPSRSFIVPALYWRNGH